MDMIESSDTLHKKQRLKMNTIIRVPEQYLKVKKEMP